MNFIGKGTVITGDIKTNSNLRIDGKIVGQVVCENTLTIGEGGIIEGDIQANNAIIGGKIKGKIVAVGPGKLDNAGKRLPLEIKVNDTVLYSKYAGTEFKVDNKEYLIMNEDDILAVLN